MRMSIFPFMVLCYRNKSSSSAYSLGKPDFIYCIECMLDSLAFDISRTLHSKVQLSRQFFYVKCFAVDDPSFKQLLADCKMPMDVTLSDSADCSIVPYLILKH